MDLPLDCYLDEVLLAMPKKDGWGGLADGIWAVCPALARGRCACGAGGGSCVGVVARVAWCVCGSQWFSVFSLVEGLHPVGSGSLRPGELGGPLRAAGVLLFARGCSCVRAASGFVCVAFACRVWVRCPWAVEIAASR